MFKSLKNLIGFIAANRQAFTCTRSLRTSAVVTSQPQLARRSFLPGSDGPQFPEYLNGPRETYPFRVNASDLPNVSTTSSPEECAEMVKDQFKHTILKYGAILYRGFPLNTPDDFANFYNGLGKFESMGYVGGAAVRKQVGKVGKVYTASDEPPETCIELHNEMAYLPYWPSLILFFCLTPPAPGCGGESGISDVREQLAMLDQPVVQKFEKLGVRYHWHWQDKNPDYKSWQDVFVTENRKDVDDYMAKNGFEYEWNEDGSISYWYNRPAILNHPQTGEKLWFNHIHRKHSSAWKNHPYWMKFDLPGKLYPSHTLYGDGTEIEDEVIQHIRNVGWKTAVGFQMEKSDVMILENHIVQHSRLSFTGERKLLAALLK